MTIYLVTGCLDLVATSLADARSLCSALSQASTATNSAIIANVVSKVETLVAGDTGEPLVISSIDDAAGTISAWVNDATQTVAFAVGDAFPGGASVYANANCSTISSNTRTGTLNLSGAALSAALSGTAGRPPRSASAQFSAQIRRTTAGGATETMALFPITIRSSVL